MLSLTATVLVAGLAASTHSAAINTTLTERQWAGKCTIGIEHWNNFIPGGGPATGGGANTHTTNSYAYIVGSDNVQTNVEVQAHDDGKISADGNYGGISGGNWHIDSYDPKAANIGACTISFTGRSDKGDETFSSVDAPEGTCDLYHFGGAFTASSGCRCRFDCQ